MSGHDTPMEQIVRSLQERAKELNCLYAVDEVLNRRDGDLASRMRAVVDVIPPGWQYPDVCRARIELNDSVHTQDGFVETPWLLGADIVTEGRPIGRVDVAYLERRPQADEGPFLKEERRLINVIAERIGYSVLQERLLRDHAAVTRMLERAGSESGRGWRVIIDFLRRTDQHLLSKITRKMINHLCWEGFDDAGQLLQEVVAQGDADDAETLDENRPLRRTVLRDLRGLSDRTFDIAARHLREDEIVALIQHWIEEDKSSDLIDTLENPRNGLTEIAEAIERYESSGVAEADLPMPARRSLRVALLRRLFTDQLDFINVAKEHVSVDDFTDLIERTVYTSTSHGRLGGKSAGLFLAARVIADDALNRELFAEIRVPKTWYVSSDGILEFIRFNNLEDLYNRKYQDVEQIRQEYPHVVQVFKNSRFPPELAKGLSAALDDLEGRPVIVRSSSLLEDRTGAAFSGKYKSLFLANQGGKRERLEALLDAIAEVYASVLGADPIEYRAERGLLDVHEEMGVMIQEVVGRRVGRYFLPAYSGVAFGRNEYRWSARIRREDGLVRIVPGLGTRAVDRVADDYPTLISPGQPNLRVNVTVDEIVRYSPKQADVIDLDRNRFATVELRSLLRECGEGYPRAREIVSIVDHDRVRQPRGLEPDWEKDDLVVTFDGVVDKGRLIPRIAALLQTLKEALGHPVDIEFAHDGEALYLLQCRTQSRSEEHVPVAIPRNLPRDRVVFSANRHVTNGRVPDVTHLVYVDPDAYADLPDAAAMREVGRTVGRLNQVLPRRRFVLLGPGRWGSRGDIRLGVPVTYSDINNTSMLIEIARQKGNYVPELSFGTHFFQDLVEADILYLPLYPDAPDVRFDETFLRRAGNRLADLAPEFAHLEGVVRVIDVAGETDGQIVRVLLNADLDEAVAILAEPAAEREPGRRPGRRRRVREYEPPPEDHWRWRLRMAEQIATAVDPRRFGVRAFYVFGSAKNATAGAASDLDLLIHVDGDPERRRRLALWLEGWSRALAEVNYLRTGYRSDGLLDVHYVTDADVEAKTSFAAKIDAVTDAARPLMLGPSSAG